jgi:hypothetical protein
LAFFSAIDQSFAPTTAPAAPSNQTINGGIAIPRA